jgi:hypothetical protein
MDVLTATFLSGGALRSRGVSAVVESTVLDVPVPPKLLLADWQREISGQLGLEAGDIEPLPLARTRLRWPELRLCFDAVARWLGAVGLPDVLGSSDVALMASRGTRYHHDGAHYGSMAFCNLFLSGDGGVDFHFPAAGHRIALVRGTAVLFDPCQPHAIIRRGAPGFDAADFASAAMHPQVFLSWELPIEHDAVTRCLGVTFDGTPKSSPQPPVEHVWRNGAPVRLCPKTGDWLSLP